MLLSDSFSETKDFLLSIISEAPYGIITIDFQGIITMINMQAVRNLQINVEEKNILGKSIFGYTKGIPELDHLLRKCLYKKQSTFDIELIQYEDKFLSIKIRPNANGSIISIENITKIKAVESELLNSVLEGQEIERRRIAMEIHDGLGPLLSTIRLNIESISSEQDELSETMKKRFEITLHLIDSLAQEMRSVSHDLIPKSLIDFGLSAGLESLCRRIDETNKMVVEFISSTQQERFDKMIELGIYRMGQELINNTVKHSHAGKMVVQLIRHTESLVLMVEDDGIGFDLLSRDKDGIGLTNIETRATALKGKFIIDSSVNHGTIATIEIPL